MAIRNLRYQGDEILKKKSREILNEDIAEEKVENKKNNKKKIAKQKQSKTKTKKNNQSQGLFDKFFKN